MKYVPKLFNTEMVQAIQALTKNQTRRTKGLKEINKDPDKYIFDAWARDIFFNGKFARFINKNTGSPCDAAPEAQIGDIFWVRETHQHTKILNLNPEDENYGYVYKASENGKDFKKNIEGWKWKPSIFMPKHACRLFLEVTNVRVERLHDISEEDAKAEGMQKGIYREGPNNIKREFQLELNNHASYIDGMRFVWQNINGRESWDSNPWVWAYSFKQIEKPLNFI